MYIIKNLNKFNELQNYIFYPFKDLWPLFKNNFDIKNTIWKKINDIFMDFLNIHLNIIVLKNLIFFGKIY
jgi:hypothetical protein